MLIKDCYPGTVNCYTNVWSTFLFYINILGIIQIGYIDIYYSTDNLVKIIKVRTIMRIEIVIYFLDGDSLRRCTIIDLVIVINDSITLQTGNVYISEVKIVHTINLDALIIDIIINGIGTTIQCLRNYKINSILNLKFLIHTVFYLIQPFL